MTHVTHFVTLGGILDLMEEEEKENRYMNWVIFHANIITSLLNHCIFQKYHELVTY